MPHDRRNVGKAPTTPRSQGVNVPTMDDAFFLHHMCPIVLVPYIAPAYIVSHLLVRSHGELDPMLIQIREIDDMPSLVRY